MAQDVPLSSSIASVELPPRGTFGPYVPIGLLGRGGMGAVYRVRHEQLGAEYALKVIRPEAMDVDALGRFRREMELLARVEHPGIVRIHAAGKTDKNEPYYVMDLLAGQTLGALLHARGALTPREAGRYLAPVARAIAFLHERGILHRDLKPDNIFISSDDDAPRIVDFGLAKAASGTQSLTRSGDLVGTPAFMAPEQVEAIEAPTAAVDVWALGIILYQLVTGRLAFDMRGGPVATFQAILTREPPLPSSADPDLAGDVDELFLRCVERKPEARLAALELAEQLELLAAGEPLTDEGKARARIRAQRRRRLFQVGVGIGTAAIVLAVALQFETTRRWFRGAPTPRPIGENAAEVAAILASYTALDPLVLLDEGTLGNAPAALEARLAALNTPNARLGEPRIVARLLASPRSAHTAWDAKVTAPSAHAGRLGAALALIAGDGERAEQRLGSLEPRDPRTLALRAFARLGRDDAGAARLFADALEAGVPFSVAGLRKEPLAKAADALAASLADPAAKAFDADARRVAVVSMALREVECFSIRRDLVVAFARRWPEDRRREAPDLSSQEHAFFQWYLRKLSTPPHSDRVAAIDAADTAIEDGAAASAIPTLLRAGRPLPDDAPLANDAIRAGLLARAAKVFVAAGRGRETIEIRRGFRDAGLEAYARLVRVIGLAGDPSLESAAEIRDITANFDAADGKGFLFELVLATFDDELRLARARSLHKLRDDTGALSEVRELVTSQLARPRNRRDAADLGAELDPAGAGWFRARTRGLR